MPNYEAAMSTLTAAVTGYFTNATSGPGNGTTPRRLINVSTTVNRALYGLDRRKSADGALDDGVMGTFGDARRFIDEVENQIGESPHAPHGIAFFGLSRPRTASRSRAPS